MEWKHKIREKSVRHGFPAASESFSIRSSPLPYIFCQAKRCYSTNTKPTLHTIMSAAAAPKVKKATKPKVAAAHPPFANMIATAVKALKERNGSSRQAILKYIIANNKVGDAAKAQVRVRLALKKMIAAKKVVAGGAAGKKGAGCFKLAAAAKVEKPKKKPAAKKPKAKKVAKKPAAKKAVKAKKPAAKKAAKKPAAKKPAAKKPAAKKPAAKKPAAKKAAPKKK